MKKIISSAIAVAMLSSTVAMAAYVAPTPQIEKISATQTFDGLTDVAYGSEYDTGAEKLKVEGSGNTLSVAGNPFAKDPETTKDKVIQITANNGTYGNSSYYMFPKVTLNDGDIFKASFDVALKDKYRSENVMFFRINDKTIFKLFPNGYVQDMNKWADINTDVYLTGPNENAFTHYEIMVDKTARTVKIVSGENVKTFNMQQDFSINSIDNIEVKFDHTNNAQTGTFYLNNMSYETVRATSENEKLETFDELLPVSKPYPQGFSGTLPNASYNFPEGGTITTTQTIEPERGNVFAVDKNEADGYIAMPLNYTIDNDDVFTFQFDYAQEEKGTYWYVYLNDISKTNGVPAARNITATNVRTSSETCSSLNSCLFGVRNDQIHWLGNKAGWPKLEQTGKFSTVTVVIDNSDDDYNNKCTLAIYVDGELFDYTKYYLEDNDSEATSFKNIDGVSIKFAGSSINRYVDNMYATLTDKKISVADGVASYTYPVVYKDEAAATADTNSIFVKAYYDGNNRLLSAETASAEPTKYSRTVTTELIKPAGTKRTKVFRWDNLNNINKLSPAYDSNPPSNSGE